MMVYGILDALFFACIACIALGSCSLYLKKCKEDSQMIRQLRSRVQVVPVIAVELPRVPDLPDD